MFRPDFSRGLPPPPPPPSATFPICKKPFLPNDRNPADGEARRWEACAAKTLRAVVPAVFSEWQPSPGHEPASQRMLDILRQPRQYRGSGRHHEAPTVPAAAAAVISRSRQPSSAPAAERALLHILPGASVRKAVRWAQEWTDGGGGGAAAAAAAAAAVAGARTAVKKLGANVLKYGTGRAAGGERGGQNPRRKEAGQSWFVPPRVFGAGGRRGGAAGPLPK